MPLVDRRARTTQSEHERPAESKAPPGKNQASPVNCSKPNHLGPQKRSNRETTKGQRTQFVECMVSMSSAEIGDVVHQEQGKGQNGDHDKEEKVERKRRSDGRSLS